MVIELTLEEGLGGFCGSEGEREEDGRHWKGGWRKEDCPGMWASGHEGQRHNNTRLQDLKDLIWYDCVLQGMEEG